MRRQLIDALRGDRTWLPGVWVGALLIGLVTIPKLIFFETLGQRTPFLLYFAAIMLAAYRGGALAGLLTTLASACVAAALFLDTPGAVLARNMSALSRFSVSRVSSSPWS